MQEFIHKYMQSFLVFWPLLAGLAVLLCADSQKNLHRRIAFWAVCIELIASVYVFIGANAMHDTSSVYLGKFHYGLREQYSWFGLNLGSLGRWKVDFHLGLDGFSAPMVLLAGIVIWIAVWVSDEIIEKTKAYYALFLLMASAVMGAFLAVDLFLFYICFEFVLLPLYFLIGIWGGERREYASIKFFVYTLVGSLFILLPILALNFSSFNVEATAALYPGGSVNPAKTAQALLVGAVTELEWVHSFSILDVSEPSHFIPGTFLHPDYLLPGGLQARMLAFWFVVIGLMVKLPAFPLHTWLPDAHTEAPTPVSAILAGIMLKLGGYALLRLGFGVFSAEAQAMAQVLSWIGVASIVWGASVALGQTDLKRMVAYSSISHMGFVMLGLATFTLEGWGGAVYQMFSHGLISPLLFILTGYFYHRTHNRNIIDFGGIASTMPHFSIYWGLASFAALGLPVFSGFIAEVLTLMGAFKASSSQILSLATPIFALLGMLIMAACFIWFVQRLLMGPLFVRKTAVLNKLVDLDLQEQVAPFILLILIVIAGVYPAMILDILNPAIEDFLASIPTLINTKP